MVQVVGWGALPTISKKKKNKNGSGSRLGGSRFIENKKKVSITNFFHLPPPKKKGGSGSRLEAAEL